MTKNSHAIFRTTRARLGIAAAGVIAAATMLAPASAFAAPAAGSAAVTPNDALCTHTWNWQADADFGVGGWSQVEWTANPCNYLIQERSWCIDTLGNGSWSNSGVVMATYLWDKSGCGVLDSITRGEVRFNYGSGWTTYQTFWTA